MQTGHSSKWRGGWSKHTCSSKTLIRPRCNKRLFFFKTCRRYWTEGGSLRNVPVGGSSRKNNSSPSTTSSFTPLFATAAPPLMLCSPPPHSSRDLQPSVIIPQAPNPNACFAWFEGGYNVHGLQEGGPERLLVVPCESLKQAPGGADKVEGNGLVMKADEKEEGHGRRKDGY